MGRRPLPVQSRASVSKHAYLTQLQAAWLAERDMEFSPWVRSVIDREMNADEGYVKKIMAQKIAQHDAEHQDLLRKFEVMTGGPIQASDLQAAAAKDEDSEETRYRALWAFFVAKRPDICKTIMGTAYGKEIVGEKILLELIDVQRDNFHIVDSPKRVLDELRQLDYSPGEQAPASVPVEAPDPERLMKLKKALSALKPEDRAALLKKYAVDRITAISETQAISIFGELEAQGKE